MLNFRVNLSFVFCAALISGVYSNPLSAAPDKTTEIFMNKPVSLMSWGLFRLTSELQSYKNVHNWPEEFFSTGTFYNWDEDAIYLSLMSVYAYSEAASAKNGCKEATSVLRLRKPAN